jgi:outer membrane protein TolC
VTCDGATVPVAPLTLDQAVELAFAYSPQLEVMRSRIARAEAGEEVAFADFLPEARASYRHLQSGNGSETFVLPTLPTTVGNVAFGQATDHFDRSELSVQWTLYDFGRTAGRFGQSVSSTEIARLQFVRAKQTVAYRVASAYFAVLQAQATRRVAEEAVQRAEADLKDARNYLKRGTGLRNEVYRAEAFLAEMRLGLVRASTTVATALAGLNQVIGINVSAPTQLVDVVDERQFQRSLGECLQVAADNREEIRVVLKTVQSAQLGKDVAAADFFPRVFLGGTGAHQGPKQTVEQDLVVGGLNVEMSLFEGGRRKGRLHSAQAEIREAIAQGKEICDRIAYEVNIAWYGIEDARQRIVLSRTAATQATENLRVVRGQFARGDATPTDVVDAELADTRAQQNLAVARYDYLTALARLAYAVGTPLPLDPPVEKGKQHE